ncbi:unnamed protein product [Prunus armeniaca]|uniref:Uncharacterized protein n=1 Tax=Prunus armeniaca TaxID=36596 RepID=A0A6J5U7B9_PRUAR|nr:unnamed protein product [Prunus armeniaca]
MAATSYAYTSHSSSQRSTAMVLALVSAIVLSPLYVTNRKTDARYYETKWSSGFVLPMVLAGLIIAIKTTSSSSSSSSSSSQGDSFVPSPEPSWVLRIGSSSWGLAGVLVLLINVFIGEAYRRGVFNSAMRGVSLEALRRSIALRSHDMTRGFVELQSAILVSLVLGIRFPELASCELKFYDFEVISIMDMLIEGMLSLNTMTEDGNIEEYSKTESGTIKAPYVGMVFDTMEEARNYYEEYGRQEGFWIRTRSSSKTRRRLDEVTSRQFVCAHEGKYMPKNTSHKASEGNDERDASDIENMKRTSKNCSTVKCGCKASMRIKLDRWSNKWKVSSFQDSHNHKPVTPERRMKMKSNKVMPKVAKILTETFHEENLPIAKVPSILGGPHIGFNNRDCYNHLRNVRHRQLDGGDAQSVLTYFRKKQAENPQFFYAIQCDENGRASNFFWVDARSRLAYHYFGDVVTFDTTYRTNKYDMPFAPFTGVNHHLQSIQFGCALLQDETEVTFLWLFETWLEAMGGRHPVSIITDQDLAMK